MEDSKESRDKDEPFVDAMIEVMAERKLNYSDIGRATGHAPNQIMRWLKGERRLPSYFLIEFCEALELPADYLHRKAGLLPKLDLSGMIEADTALDPGWKEILKVSYETAVRDSATRRRGMGQRLR